MSLRIGVPILLLAIFCAISVSGLEWVDEDAIYIEDGVVHKAPNPATLPRGDPNTNITTEPPPVTAIPVEIIPGLCVKASECYPILFYSGELSEDNETRVVDHNLYKFILSTANYCEPSDLPPSVLEDKGRSGIPSDDVYIWCPIRTFSSSKPVALVRTRNSTEVTDENLSISTDMTTSPTPQNCGPLKTSHLEEDDAKAKYRVVGGEVVAPGEMPWVVAVTNKGKQFCTGSLIDARHVLLAAHCVSHLRRKHLKNIKVFIGDHNIKDPADIDHQERNVSAIIFHHKFSMRTVHSDIGMMYLSEPVTFADNIAPICLSKGDATIDDGSTYGILTGWGQPAEDKPASDILMKTHLRIWRRDECVMKYEGKIPGGITNRMLCAGSIAPKLRDACKGDSGGPLSLVRDNRMEQVGIVSFGIGCGQYPGVFSKVADYLDWIEKHRMRSSNYFGV